MRILTYFVILCLILNSCKTINIFQSNDLRSSDELIAMGFEPHHLIPGDKVTISVWKHDDLSVGSVFNIYNTNESFGKWVMVSADTCLVIPSVGHFNVRDLTIETLRDSIVSRLIVDILNPIVVVKVLNKTVTVLGEVKSPGNFILEKDKTSLTEIIGSCEGLLPYADVEHVEIIRDNNSYLIDLTISGNRSANNIFLKSGDVVKVPSLKGKKLDQKAPTIIPFTSALTSVAVLLSIFLR